jgi:DNA polymerase-3 subunit chi
MATEVRFYHLVSRALESALPEILGKAVDKGRVIVRVADAARVEPMAESLWTQGGDASFLPHGTKKDGRAAQQPIWITEGDDNPNGAKILILTGGAVAKDIASFDLCCEMLDGNNEEQILAARERWKIYKDAGYTVAYWKQTESGGWEKKA